MRDDEQLKMLSIFHYVVGGLAALFSLFPLIYLVMGLVFVLMPDQSWGKEGPPPAFLGWFFVAIGAVMITIGMVFAGFVLRTGRCLSRRKSYTFCLVMACVECIFMPFGTVLGVFTIIVLMRESVKKLFPQPPCAEPDDPVSP
jgi:hypothetical protein